MRLRSHDHKCDKSYLLTRLLLSCNMQKRSTIPPFNLPIKLTLRSTKAVTRRITGRRLSAGSAVELDGSNIRDALSVWLLGPRRIALWYPEHLHLLGTFQLEYLHPEIVRRDFASVVSDGKELRAVYSW